MLWRFALWALSINSCILFQFPINHWRLSAVEKAKKRKEKTNYFDISSHCVQNITAVHKSVRDILDHETASVLVCYTIFSTEFLWGWHLQLKAGDVCGRVLWLRWSDGQLQLRTVCSTSTFIRGLVEPTRCVSFEEDIYSMQLRGVEGVGWGEKSLFVCAFHVLIHRFKRVSLQNSKFSTDAFFPWCALGSSRDALNQPRHLLHIISATQAHF